MAYVYAETVPLRMSGASLFTATDVYIYNDFQPNDMLRVDGPGQYLQFIASGRIAYDAGSGKVTAGDLTQLSYFSGTAWLYSIDHLTGKDVAPAFDYFSAGDKQGLFRYLLDGNDKLYGTSQADTLIGYAGADQFLAGAGADADGAGTGSKPLLLATFGSDSHPALARGDFLVT